MDGTTRKVGLYALTLANGKVVKVFGPLERLDLAAIRIRHGAEVDSIALNNAHRIPAKQALTDNGTTLDELVFAGSIPACCDQGCEVEPDGECEHQCPSVLMAMGLI